MKSDITSLIEIFLKPGEDHPVLHDFPEQLADEHQQYYKHVLVDEDNVLWYWFMSTAPIEDELMPRSYSIDWPLLIWMTKRP